MQDSIYSNKIIFLKGIEKSVVFRKFNSLYTGISLFTNISEYEKEGNR